MRKRTMVAAAVSSDDARGELESMSFRHLAALALEDDLAFMVFVQRVMRCDWKRRMY